MGYCCSVTMLLLILQIPFEQKLHLLGRQLHVHSPLKESLNALLVPKLNLLQNAAALLALDSSALHSTRITAQFKQPYSDA